MSHGGVMLKSDHEPQDELAPDGVASSDLDLLPLCEAKTRARVPCKRYGNVRNGRCNLHGGASTGPINPVSGASHPRYTTGKRTKEAIATRKLIAHFRQSLKAYE